MTGQTVILRSDYQRKLAHELIAKAPQDAVVNVREATRTNEQNSKMQVLLSDVSRAKPENRVMTTEQWKGVFMDACGYEQTFIENLERTSFLCLGFKSSRLTVAEMSDLIECIYEYGARHDVRWSEEL